MMMVLLASRDRPTRPDRPGRSQEKFLRSLFKISSTHQKLMKNTKIKVYACLYQAVQYVSFNNIDYMSANVRGIYSLSLSLNSEARRAASVCILMFCFFRRVFFFSLTLSLSLSLSFYYVCMMLSLLIKCTHLAPFALAHFRALLNTCSLPLLLVRFHTRARVSTPPRTPSSPLPLSRQSSLNTAL